MKVLDYKKIMEKGLVLHGVVALAQETFKEIRPEDALYITDVELIKQSRVKKIDSYMKEAEEEPIVIMYRDRIGLIYQKNSLAKFVHNRISFKIEAVDETEDGLVVYASLRMIAEERRDKMIEILTSATAKNEPVAVKIEKIKEGSAYLVSKNNTKLIMRQKDFSSDWTPISSVHEVGETIEVLLAEVSEGKRIFVRRPELYAIEKISNEEVLDKYRPDMTVTGKIMSISTNCCFVRILPGVDMLCPIPRYVSIEKDEEVKVRILQIREDETGRLKIRGKIADKVGSDRFVLDYNIEDLIASVKE